MKHFKVHTMTHVLPYMFDWHNVNFTYYFFCLFFYFTVHRRSLLLYPSIQSSEASDCQHGRADSPGHYYSLHLLCGHSDGGHDGEGKAQPHHLLWYTADALCVHFTGKVAGANCQGIFLNMSLQSYFTLIGLSCWLVDLFHELIVILRTDGKRKAALCVSNPKTTGHVQKVMQQSLVLNWSERCFYTNWVMFEQSRWGVWFLHKDPVPENNHIIISSGCLKQIQSVK